jgi:hypothetical protein
MNFGAGTFILWSSPNDPPFRRMTSRREEPTGSTRHRDGPNAIEFRLLEQ